MKKTNFKRGVLLLLFVSLALLAVTGCQEQPSVFSSDVSTTISGEQNPPITEDQKDLISRWEETMQNPDDQTVRFSAEPYIQNPELSWSYLLDVEVKDGQIYLSDVLYDKITYTEAFDLQCIEGLLSFAEHSDGAIAQTLEQIRTQKGCYLLETDSDSKYGKQIAVYEIDSTYYFVSYYGNGEVVRIHFAEAITET